MAQTRSAYIMAGLALGAVILCLQVLAIAVSQLQYTLVLPCVILKKIQMALIAMGAMCIPCSSALYELVSWRLV